MANKNLMLQYIKDELNAGGIINLELPDAVISRNLDRALAYSSDYFNQVMYKTVTPKPDGQGTSGYIDLSELDNDALNPADGDDTGYTGIPTVTAVYPTQNTVNLNSALMGLNSVFLNVGNNMSDAMMSYSKMVNQLSTLESILGRNAKVVGNRLYVANYYSSVTVEYIPQVVRIENVVEGEWTRWLIEYTAALCKRQLAQSRGKFVVSSSPSQPNAATLLAEANEVITRLEEEIQSKGFLAARR